MALTLSDVHKRMYARRKAQGMTHEEIIDSVPEQIRQQFIKDIKKDFYQSHYGMSKGLFLITLIGGSLFFTMILLIIALIIG